MGKTNRTMFDSIHRFQQLSSCIGSPVTWGATSITSTNVNENWLGDDVMSAATTYAMTGSDQGMFNSYAAISTYWTDTTNMDNLRGADITDHSVAGSIETIGANNDASRTNADHAVHTASDSTWGA